MDLMVIPGFQQYKKNGLNFQPIFKQPIFQNP